VSSSTAWQWTSMLCCITFVKKSTLEFPNKNNLHQNLVTFKTVIWQQESGLEEIQIISDTLLALFWYPTPWYFTLKHNWFYGLCGLDCKISKIRKCLCLSKANSYHQTFYFLSSTTIKIRLRKSKTIHVTLCRALKSHVLLVWTLGAGLDLGQNDIVCGKFR